MRKLKKFKRYDEGGAVGAGSGDPFSYTDFSNRARNLREPSKAAPIEERKPPKAEPAKETKTETAAEPAETKPVETGRGKITSTPTMTDEESRADSDKGAAPSSSTTTGNSKKAEAYRQSLMPVNKPKPKPPAPAPAAEKTPTAPAKAPRAASPDEIPGTDVETPYKGEKIQNSGQFAQSAMAAFPALRGVGAGVRGAMGLGRMLESAPKAEGKGTGKFPEEKPEITVPRTPAVERKAKVEGPPASAAAPKPKTPAEQMGVRETKPMRDAREAKEKFEAAGKSAKEAADKSSKNAADEVAAEAAKRAASKRQTPDNRRFPNKGSATTGRPKASGEVRATGNKFNKPVGEKRGPKTDEVLEREGLSAKKGGKIPAFKKGGLVGRGDGCAQRGKTKGRMV